MQIHKDLEAEQYIIDAPFQIMLTLFKLKHFFPESTEILGEQCYRILKNYLKIRHLKIILKLWKDGLHADSSLVLNKVFKWNSRTILFQVRHLSYKCIGKASNTGVNTMTKSLKYIHHSTKFSTILRCNCIHFE